MPDTSLSTSASLTQITADILRLTLPVPFRGLGHVHVYLLQDEEGWVVIDTGMNTPEARKGWHMAARSAGFVGEDINRIILTHGHPDHMGLAGWLQERSVSEEAKARASGAAVLLSTRTRDSLRYWADAKRSVRDVIDFMEHCGIPEDQIEPQLTREFDTLRAATKPHPKQLAFLNPGDQVEIGARTFRVLAAPGHSDGHILLYDAEDRLLISGDHVLKHITPNVSRWPATGTDPLGRYLASLRDLSGLDVRLALPGHGPPITDWHGRLRSIEVHHATRLMVMLDVIRDRARRTNQGVTVLDVAGETFELKALQPGELRFALAETVAHLEYLVDRGRLRREEDTAWQFWPAKSGRRSPA